MAQKQIVTEDVAALTIAPASPVIAVDRVFKSYRPQQRRISIRHEGMRLLQHALRREETDPETPFWALHDVSFEVQAGESLAIVGRNGSGKTTLLRILSHITRPTRGHARVDGRFAVLIALGAGFDYERTGRENIYLNSAIQGVHPRDVDEIIQDVIAFSELGTFIDAPVKRYSSGMITRLGFSIAAHIFPDIVFIDEVLAVGDQGFQMKCIERIGQMKQEGRTLLFVSHDPGSIRLLCERAIWLHHGKLQLDGPTEDVLQAYDAMLRAESGVI